MDRWVVPSRRAAAAGLMVLLGLTPLVIPEPPDGPPAFPDGEWHGTSVYKGSITQSGVWAAADGDVIFDMTVVDGEVVGGSLRFAVTGTSQTGTGSSELTFSGSMQMSGTAVVVEFSGPTTMTGTATSGGFTVPIDFTGPSDGTMSPSYVTCNQVNGDLATQARNIQESAGFAKPVTGDFIAVRTGGIAGSGEALLQEYLALRNAIADVLATDPTAAQVLKLTQQYEAFAGKLVAIGSCESLPGDLDPDLSDDLIAALLQDLLQKALDHPELYSAQELLSLLGSGLRMDAVGVAVSDSAPYEAFAKNLLVQFGVVLLDKLHAASAAGDQNTIKDILIAAQQYGLGALAKEAKKLYKAG